MEAHGALPTLSAEEAAAADAGKAGISTATKVAGILALSLAICLFALDATMVSVAIPRMVSDLGGEDLLSWIGTSYLLTSTAFGPLWGRLGDVLGRKATFLSNIVIFALASLVCALAPNMVTLIVGRALQGVGGGAMQALVYVLMADLVTMRERGMYQALMGSVAGVSAVLGPLLGGVITDGWSWRGLFWINLPLGAIAFATSWFALKVPNTRTGSWKETAARIDYGGALICIAGIVLFLFGLTSGGTNPWTSAIVLAPMIIGVAVFAGFLVFEAYVPKEPNVPIYLFKLKNIPIVYAASFFAGWCMQGSAYYLPLFFQLVLGDSPTTAGLKTMPQIGALIPVSIVVGIISSKTGIYTPFPKVGMAIMAVGIGLCAMWTSTTPLGQQIGYMIIMGVGAGLTVSMLMVSVQANLPVADIGPGTTVATFLQTIGGVLGIAVGGAIMQTTVADVVTPTAVYTISQTYGVPPETVGQAVQSIATGHGVPSSLQMPEAAVQACYALVRGGYELGLTRAFISLAAAVAVGWVIILFLRHTALSTTLEHTAAAKSGLTDEEEVEIDDAVKAKREDALEVVTVNGGTTPSPVA
ncbi:major facilitator superfamily domain-containing protein [Hyaloraphidium curvatum]|nr:major facilitator superfamily domain-containing protein [Hyaloraphidium curvatum]